MASPVTTPRTSSVRPATVTLPRTVSPAATVVAPDACVGGTAGAALADGAWAPAETVDAASTRASRAMIRMGLALALVSRGGRESA